MRSFLNVFFFLLNIPSGKVYRQSYNQQGSYIANYVYAADAIKVHYWRIAEGVSDSWRRVDLTIH